MLNDLKKDDLGKTFHIRIGVHYGETFKLPDGDRRGMAVDMAFRIESVKIVDMHQTLMGIKKDMLPRVDRIFISEIVNQMVASYPQVNFISAPGQDNCQCSSPAASANNCNFSF